MTDLKTILRTTTRARAAAGALPAPCGSDDCAPPVAKPTTKAALVESLLLDPDGASLAQLCDATDWQPHSCRAFLAGLKTKCADKEEKFRAALTTADKADGMSDKETAADVDDQVKGYMDQMTDNFAIATLAPEVVIDCARRSDSPQAQAIVMPGGNMPCLAAVEALAASIKAGGADIVTGGTDNHLMLVDLRPKKITGKAAEAALGRAHITVNKNAIPFDKNPPMVASGVRLGTPAVTTRGMREPEMDAIAHLIVRALSAPDDESVLTAVRRDVEDLCRKFPLYPALSH